MPSAAPKLVLRLAEEGSACHLPASWNHKRALYSLQSGAPVVGHRLKVSHWIDGVPCWAAADSVVANLASQRPGNVLRVHGWAEDPTASQGPPKTALVVTDVPGDTLLEVLERGVQRSHLASHRLTQELLAEILSGFSQLQQYGAIAGSLHPTLVYVQLPPETAPRAQMPSVWMDPLYPILLSAPGNVIPSLDQSYAAPELNDEKQATSSQQTDLYALGVLAWTIIHYPIPPSPGRPLSVDPSLVPSTVLGEAVEACTDPDPARRLAGQQGLLSIPNLALLSTGRDRCLNSDSVKWSTLIGQGSFGKVYLGDLDGVRVAVKVITGESGKEAAHLDACRELGFITSLSHPNIAEVYGWVDKGPELWLVMKYYPQGNLEDWLMTRHSERQLQLLPPSQGGPFGWGVFFNVAIGVARALAYLAEPERSVVHRDVKPSNILLESVPLDKAATQHEEVPVLADFGLGKRLRGTQPEGSSRRVGTEEYAAPELMSPGLYPLTSKADVYSLGVVMKHLLLWQPKKVGKGLTFDPPAVVADLVENCLKRNPNERPTAREAWKALCDARGSLDTGARK